jgi:Na+/melibiose symporter-like transporter
VYASTPVCVCVCVHAHVCACALFCVYGFVCLWFCVSIVPKFGLSVDLIVVSIVHLQLICSVFSSPSVAKFNKITINIWCNGV